MVNMFGNLWLTSDEIHFGPILYTQYFRFGSTKNHESSSIIFVSSASLCFSGIDGVSRVILAESLLTVHKRVQNAQKKCDIATSECDPKDIESLHQSQQVIQLLAQHCFGTGSRDETIEKRIRSSIWSSICQTAMRNVLSRASVSPFCYTTRLCLDCNLFWISEYTVSIRHNP